jgi:thioredoxin-like negative regulator of GroEL
MQKKIVGVKIEDKTVPIQENYTEQFAQFLAAKKESASAIDRAWSDYLSAKFGDLLRFEERPAESNPDAELVQLVQKTADGRWQTAAEQIALALIYIKLQRYDDVVSALDSMDLSTADLPVREWILANLAVKQAKNVEPDSVLMKRGDEAAGRLLNFRLSDRDSFNLVPVLQYFNRPQDVQNILDHLSVSVSDHRLLSDLFYKMNTMGSAQKENTAKVAQRILLNPSFLQNARRLTADVFLLEAAVKTLREQDRLDTVLPILEARLRGLRDRTDSRILLARLYLQLDRQEEAKMLALELSQEPTAEPERRQMVVALLVRFGLQKELETMNRLLLER